MTKPAKPRKYRPPTARDLLREIYNEAGARPAFKFVRAHGTDLERTLRAQGLSERLADTMSAKEQEEAIAAFSGLRAGRIAGTLPERLVGSWLVKNNYQFAGEGYNYNPLSGDWGFQVPLEGGRLLSGGAVVDFLISPQASGTKKGMVIRVNGQYFHSQASLASRDERSRILMVSKGYAVSDIWDYEAEAQGVLDAKMKYFLSGGLR